jgi:phage gp29-like protein
MVTDQSPNTAGSVSTELPANPDDVPQTSRAISLQNEFQTHPGRGLTPSRLASILLDAEQGNPIAQFDLFEDMEERDGHIASEMVRRRRAVTRLDWDILPPPNPSAAEKKAAAQLKEQVTALPDMEEIQFDTTDAIGKSFACQEIEWEREENLWQPRSIVHRPQSWFRFVRGYTEEIRLRSSGLGDPLQPGGWITHTHKAKSGYLARSSLFRVLVWPYLFKNYSVGDLAEFLEIYGLPLRLGKYPPGAGDVEKATLLRALISLGHNAAGIIPSTMALDFQKAAEGNAQQSFEVMIDYCERTESKVILGATLTSQAGRGSNTNALGAIHNEVRKDLTDSDAKQIASTWTRDLLWPMALFNGLIADRKRCPRFAFNLQEPEDMANFATSLPPLVGMGMRIKVDWAQEKLGIPLAEDGDEILKPVPSSQPASGNPAGKADVEPAAAATIRWALLKGGALSGTPVTTPNIAIATKLEQLAQPAIDAWCQQIAAMVDKAQTLEELRAMIVDAYGDLSDDELAQLLGAAMAAAQGAGRYDVDQVGRA